MMKSMRMRKLISMKCIRKPRQQKSQLRLKKSHLMATIKCKTVTVMIKIMGRAMMSKLLVIVVAKNLQMNLLQAVFPKKTRS